VEDRHCIHVYIYIQIYILMYICIFVCVYVHTHTHTRTHEHTYAHTFTYFSKSYTSPNKSGKNNSIETQQNGRDKRVLFVAVSKQFPKIRIFTRQAAKLATKFLFPLFHGTKLQSFPLVFVCFCFGTQAFHRMHTWCGVHRGECVNVGAM